MRWSVGGSPTTDFNMNFEGRPIRAGTMDTFSVRRYCNGRSAGYSYVTINVSSTHASRVPEHIRGLDWYPFDTHHATAIASLESTVEAQGVVVATARAFQVGYLEPTARAQATRITQLTLDVNEVRTTASSAKRLIGNTLIPALTAIAEE